MYDLYMLLYNSATLFLIYRFTGDRKSRIRRIVRVPAVSLRMSDIPPDDYSWRKYGQKPIKGSPHPRYTLLSS